MLAVFGSNYAFSYENQGGKEPFYKQLHMY
jgi:hypothetical protein